MILLYSSSILMMNSEDRECVYTWVGCGGGLEGDLCLCVCVCVCAHARVCVLLHLHRFHWVKGSGGQSNATVEWHIAPSAQTGTYRIRHFGHYKQIKIFKPIITAYEGMSDAFKVTRAMGYWS